MARAQLRWNPGSAVARVTPASGAFGPVTHGSQITTANTGYTAYFDTGLGRNLQLGDLTVISGTHNLTDFTAGGTGGTSGSPKVLYGYHFTGTVKFDQPWITLRGCLLDNPTTSQVLGVHNVGAFLDYCTISPATVGDECMHYESWSANRCYFRGCSDGAKINGGLVPMNITECYIRDTSQSAVDHNDTLQNVGGTGTVTVARCNLAVYPEVLLGGTGNSVIQSADMTSASVFSLTVQDCLLDGTGSATTLRLYDGGLTTNITYTATGNRFVRSTSNPGGRGSSNTTPQAQITWSGNVWDDDGSTIPAP